MENSAAHRAMRASCVFSPKSTMLLMVEATALLIWVMISTPKKLKTALRIMACRAPMHLVVMQVAMALGASVQPLTKITPRVSRTVTSRTGLENIACRKYESDTSIKISSPKSRKSGRTSLIEVLPSTKEKGKAPLAVRCWESIETRLGRSL